MPIPSASCEQHEIVEDVHHQILHVVLFEHRYVLLKDELPTRLNQRLLRDGLQFGNSQIVQHLPHGLVVMVHHLVKRIQCSLDVVQVGMIFRRMLD